MLNAKPSLSAILLLAIAVMPRWAFGDIASDLKAYWTFDQAGEQIVYNQTEIVTYDGMLGLDTEVDTDDPTWIDHGVFGTALSFDGVDDYVSLPYIFDIGSSKVTFAAMVMQTQPTGYQYFLSNKNDFVGHFIRVGFDVDNGHLRVYTEQSDDSNKMYASDQSYTGSWHHVVVTRDGATGILYVDGRYVAGFAAAGGDIGTTSKWYLGQSGTGGDFFHGYLDEVAVYDRDLTAEDVAELFYSLPLLPGDANLDGSVDLDDFGILKNHFGTSAGWSGGDFDGDGVVSLSDFGLLKINFGVGTGVHTPEPTTLVILVFCSAALFKRRR